MIGPTLGRYISARFTLMITGVFGSLFLLIYVLDFVEMLRRTSGLRNVQPGFVAFLSLLRTPAIAEQAIPFCVLGGAMFAFLGLTRRLELVVARAAGVSVWQFLAPPLLIVLVLGLFSVMFYNPISATLKQRADAIETRIFSHAGGSDADSGLWIRQKSVDGQAIIRAEESSDHGTVLANVTAFIYTPDGRFLERAEAARARLEPGFWRMTDVRITSPDAPPQAAGTYLLATDLTPAQVTQSFVAPDSVSFWELPSITRVTESAGLDATGYRLRFQKLLARPVLLMAMVLIAASFSLRFFRFGGVAKMVSGGVAAGFVLYVATKLVGDLGGAGLLNTTIAAWSPAVVASMLGILALLHQEDG